MFASHGIGWLAVPLLLLLGHFMQIPFFLVLPEALGLYFYMLLCVSGITEYLIRSTTLHV